MAATALRVRAWVRRRLGQIVLTSLVIGVIGGVIIGLAAGSSRTASAPDRYTADAGGDPDLVVVQLGGAPLTPQVASIPGVVQARSLAFVTSFLVAPDDGSPVLVANPFTGDDRLLGARVVEGRFSDPAAPDEFTVNRTFADYLANRFGTKVGDHFQVTSFDQDQVLTNRAFNSGEPPAVPVFTATFVGVTETPSDFDESGPAMVFSESFLTAHPTVGVVQTKIVATLDPATNPDTVMSAVRRLPGGGDAFNVVTRIVSADARRAVRFQATSLWMVTAIAAIAAVFVIAQLGGRMLKTPDADALSLAAVGWRPEDLAIERVIEGCWIAVIAAPAAATIGFAMTALFPLGVLRKFEPDAGVRMDWLVTSAGISAALLVVTVVAALAGRRRSSRAHSTRHVGSFASMVAARGAGVALSTGAHLTTSGPTGGRRSLGSLAPAAIGLAGLVAASIVGLSLTNIVGRPSRWGVNYDQLAGNPFVPAETDIAATVIHDPDVAELTAANVGSLTINGRETATLAFDPIKGSLLPVTLEGRPPSHADEVGLGAEVARRLGVGIGDHVDVAGPTGRSVGVQVVGIVVTPSDAGNGAAMTFDGYAALSPTATKNVLLLNFRKGASPDVASRMQAANFTPPDAVVTPTSVRALQRVTAAPFVLALVLAALLAVSCAYLLTTSTRARRRDLAVLRALGSESRQLRAIIHWQATLVAGLVVLVGLPSGVILGRWIVRLLTNTLGIVPGAQVPSLLIAGIVVVAGLTANLLAVMPARFAARTTVRELMLER